MVTPSSPLIIHLLLVEIRVELLHLLQEFFIVDNSSFAIFVRSQFIVIDCVISWGSARVLSTRKDRPFRFPIVEVHWARIVEEFTVVEVEVTESIFLQSFLLDSSASRGHSHHINCRLMLFRSLIFMHAVMALIIQHLAILYVEMKALLWRAIRSILGLRARPWSRAVARSLSLLTDWSARV